MKIKAFSFERDSLAFADIKSEVSKRLTDEAVFFESFKDPNALFNALSDALSKANAILLGVEPQLYLKFKPIIIKAFNFTPAYSEKIEERIGDKVTDEKLLKAHLLVPNESTELITSTGLYSGFYVASNSQYIMVFPLEETAVKEIFDDAALPFIKTENREELLSSLVENGASKKGEELVKKLVDNGLKLAVSSTPAAALFKDDIRACEGYENNVFFTPFVNDSGAGDRKEYAAELAKGAMELRSADIGAAVSNIFREKDGDEIKGYYAFISVATGEKAVIRRLIADGDENVENLVVEATAELYSLIEKYTDELIFKRQASEEEKKKYEAAQIEAEYKADERPSAALGKKGTIIAVAALAAAVVICIILGFKFGGYFVSPSEDPEESGLQSNPNISVTNPSENVPSSILNDETESMSVFTSESDTTSIFDVPRTVSAIENNDNRNTYRPSPETTKRRETTTSAPKTTAKAPEKTEPTKAPETKAPETKAPETEATEAEAPVESTPIEEPAGDE